MLGRTNAGGGGGLNFRVIGGTSAPSSPKENDIWVNTDVKIASYIFSVTEPENPVEGMVWISTGTSSPVAFNALKKNGLQVYPLSAKQYVSGAWVDKEVKSYQGGEWVEWWTGELYKNGDTYDAITGGWETYKHPSYPGTGTVTFEESCIHINAATTAAPGIHPKNKINFSDFDRVHIGISNYSGGAKLIVFLSTSPGTFVSGGNIAEVSLTASGDLDISAVTGEYYLNLWLPVNQGVAATAVKITEVCRI